MQAIPHADAPLSMRSPDTVMRLERMGSAHPSRLSFMRTLLRRLKAEGWTVERTLFDIDAHGVGRAVYAAKGPRKTYSLVAFAHDLPDEMRSDRVIATAWDSTFTLFDGQPAEADIERLEANVPLQEAGRISDNELTLSRANRSVRLWRHVVERLAGGEQPDAEQVEAVGYLMRTTAVYGSGKFGAADRVKLLDRPLMSAPFHIEMLTVWLIRTFTLDLVEHMARAKGGAQAVTIEPALRRRIGVGNSTGLGMAPFLVTHPALLNSWIEAKETALARVRAVPEAGMEARALFADLLKRAAANVRGWHSEHPIQVLKLARLRNDLSALEAYLEGHPLGGKYPWDRLYRWAEEVLSPEGQEQLVSLMLEPYGDLVDDLAMGMKVDEYETFRIDGNQDIGRFKGHMNKRYGWALNVDYDKDAHCARFWYVSEEKLEPRLGERHAEDGADLEQPLAIGRDIRALADALEAYESSALLADFLLAHPEHRHVVRRVQISAARPYAEIRDNLIDATMLPIDMLRCKLAFFGANRFDPRSDRWVRICMFQNAPYPHELAGFPDDDWAYPALAAAVCADEAVA